MYLPPVSLTTDCGAYPKTSRTHSLQSGRVDYSSRLFDEEAKFAVALHLVVCVVDDPHGGTRVGSHVVIQASRVPE